MKRVLSLLLLFPIVSFAVVLPAFADSEGIRVLYSSEGGDRPFWSESLAIALARSKSLDAVFSTIAGMSASEAAARLSCVLAVRAITSFSTDQDAVSDWEILDPVSDETLAKGRIEGPSPTDRELAEYWWIPVVEAAEGALPRVKKTLFHIEGAPGTLIEGLVEDLVRIPESGSLDIPLRVPGTYPWRAVSSGAYPEHGYFCAFEQGQVLAIPYIPIRPWIVETGLTMLEFPDVWVSRRFHEDTFFIRFGLFQYLLGIYLPDDGESSSVLLSLPLLMPGVGFGGYFVPSDSTIRPYACMTSFFRFLVLKEHWGFDPVAPVGLLGALGFEWKAFPRVGVFMELGATLYPFCDGFLLAASRGESTGGPFSVIYGERWLLELPVLRLGARFTL